MKNITRHIETLESIERLPSSVNGNPRYSGYCGVYFRTGVDSSHGYTIQNYVGKVVEITVGTHYGHCTLNSIKLAEEDSSADKTERDDSCDNLYMCAHCGHAESVMDDLCTECYRDALEQESHVRSESLNSIFI